MLFNPKLALRVFACSTCFCLIVIPPVFLYNLFYVRSVECWVSVLLCNGICESFLFVCCSPGDWDRMRSVDGTVTFITGRISMVEAVISSNKQVIVIHWDCINFVLISRWPLRSFNFSKLMHICNCWTVAETYVLLSCFRECGLLNRSVQSYMNEA